MCTYDLFIDSIVLKTVHFAEDVETVFICDYDKAPIPKQKSEFNNFIDNF